MLRSVKSFAELTFCSYGAEFAIARDDYKHSAPAELTYLHHARV